jgi:hypothetical protein
MPVDTAKVSRPSKKGAPPPEADTTFNLDKPATGQKVPLQVRISPELRREFKGHANDHDMNANRLFEAVWAYYKQQHG